MEKEGICGISPLSVSSACTHMEQGIVVPSEKSGLRNSIQSGNQLCGISLILGLCNLDSSEVVLAITHSLRKISGIE